MIADQIKLYSWVDVKDQLLQAKEDGKWKEGVKAEVYSSGLYIYHLSSSEERQVREWLTSLFPAALNGAGIMLENIISNEMRHLPLFIEETAHIEAEDFLPSFARPSEISSKLGNLPPKRLNEDPVIIVAHSFKGGVGRTLHSLALASVLEELDPGKKILFVDADFEAPGSTWLTPDAEIAVADVLNLVHGSEKPLDIVPMIKAGVQNQAKGNIFFLPAFRTERQLRSLEIRPEHIFRFSENPFILTDIFAELGKQLGAVYIIVDLRAGISELSASWLLDPRTSNIFVTTLNSQSVGGTVILLDLLAKQQKSYQLSPVEAPAIIISQVPSESAGSLERVWKQDEEPSSSYVSQNIHKLREAYSAYLDDISTIREGGIDPISLKGDPSVSISPHYDSLLILPNDWSVLKSLIQRSGLASNINDLAQSFLVTSGKPSVDKSNLESSRKKMLETLPWLIYAEKHLPDHFYRSDAIRNLANKNRTRLPNLVVIGAKGAGKTFLFRQILRSQRWESFLSQSISQNNSDYQSAEVVATTFPENIEKKPQYWVQYIKPAIIDALENDFNLNNWRTLWLDLMAWSAGHWPGSFGVGEKYIEFLGQDGEKKIFLFDGLEDLFQDYYNNERQQIALRALLQEVPAYIGVIPNASLGIIPFIRRDILEHVIKQNLGQFLDRYKEYELKWNRTEALRLVSWILTHYNILPIDKFINEDIADASEEALTNALFPLWGWKLGSNLSREARSAKKILNTLSNFNEEVQSRDLVRFLAEAIKEEMKLGNVHQEDRLLSPKSIYNAFPEVGKQKVHEVEQENKGNKYAEVLQKLKQESTGIKVPFVRSDSLTSEDIRILVEQGVLKQYNKKYYMAELFRLGLDIDKGKGKVKTEF